MTGDANSTKNEDEELVQLLDDALKDFKETPKKSTDDDLEDFLSVVDREAAQRAANNFQQMLENITKQQQQSPNFGSNEDAPSTSNTLSDEDQFQQTINRLFEQCKDLSDAPDEKAFMSALNKVDDGNSTTDEIMGMILQTALSKDIMFPAIKDMREKYAIYLVENRAKIDVETFERFEKQQKVINDLCTAYENDPSNGDEDGESDDSKLQASKVAALWMELQKYGAPPPEFADVNGGAGEPLFENMPFGGGQGLENGCNLM